MSDTRTYPTPAADLLAQAQPLYDAEIEAFRLTRARYWDGAFTAEQLRDALISLIAAQTPKSSPKPVLVGMLVDQYDMKHFDERPAAIAELARLKRRADEERYILAGVREHTVEQVDAEYRALVAANMDGSMSPPWMASTSVAWQEERAVATAWGFIAATIRKGKTPGEAATEAVQYFTGQVIQAARSGAMGRNWITAALDTSAQAGYAKFLDRLTILDGIVAPDGF